MCGDLLHLGREIKTLEACGVDYLHVDITDGHFVPNLTFGLDFVSAMHRATDLPLDIHLMVRHPADIIAKLDIRKGDIVSVHTEGGIRGIAAMSQKVRRAGALFGIAVDPETPVGALAGVLPLADVVILMLVSPGFARGTLIEGIMDKVVEARAYFAKKGRGNIMISVDGSVSVERAKMMAEMGADIFVGGTAGIYREGRRLEETIPLFRKAITL